jgi:hypothetical protein
VSVPHCSLLFRTSPAPQGAAVWVVTTNDNVEGLRSYQRRGFRLALLRPGAVDRSRELLKPEIPTSGAYGIPLRDKLELEMGLAQD